MKKALEQIGIVLLAFLLAASVLVGGVYAAHTLKESKLVAQSHILRTVFSDDAVGFMTLLTNKEQWTMLRSFLGAVTDAYVNFELIPVNEGQTFIAIFTSLNSNVHIESFQYHRKDLQVKGTATVDGYDEFVRNLKDTKYFYQIEEESKTQTGEEISFTILCKAKPVTAPPFIENEMTKRRTLSFAFLFEPFTL